LTGRVLRPRSLDRLIEGLDLNVRERVEVERERVRQVLRSYDMVVEWRGEVVARIPVGESIRWRGERRP
jgi:hypothetical protein